MKATSLLIIAVFLFSLGIGVFAQETAELPDPGLTPDNPFYFLETFVEDIGILFTFGDLRKAEKHATLAAERLAEVQAVVEKGKPEFVEKTLERYEDQLEKALFRAEKAETKGQSTEKVMEVLAKVGEATSVHLEILAEVYEKVPEQAKPAIEKAIEVSVIGHEKVVEVLKEKDALGEVPERISLPAEIPEEARERIQRNVQEELEREIIERAKDEALQNFESFESLRSFCIETGGPSEMCEKIPLQGFESFESLKAFCTETGGPPEICTSLETKCREAGVTTPDECLVVISTATLEAYHSVELGVSPVSLLSEEGASDQSYEVFKAKCLESGAPPEMCTSLVNDLQSSKSLRTLCTEQGGSPEMCEGFPLQDPESFEAIEAFCTETGGPPELCASLEAKCREIGVITPKECFLVLMIATVTAVPVSEEKIEELRIQREAEEAARMETSDPNLIGSPPPLPE